MFITIARRTTGAVLYKTECPALLFNAARAAAAEKERKAQRRDTLAAFPPIKLGGA